MAATDTPQASAVSAAARGWLQPGGWGVAAVAQRAVLGVGLVALGLSAWLLWPLLRLRKQRLSVEDVSDAPQGGDSGADVEVDAAGAEMGSSTESTRGAERPMYSGMMLKLKTALKPSRLLVIDESHLHRGHAGVRDAQGPETHFKVEVVSERFEGTTRIERQRLIYKLLDQEFKEGLHALQLVCRTPAEDSRHAPSTAASAAAKAQVTKQKARAARPASGPREERATEVRAPAWVEEIRNWIIEHDPVLLDVRSAQEVVAQPIEGSLHVALADLEDSIPAVLKAAGSRDRPIGTFCAAGIRSQTALSILESSGFTCVKNVHSAEVLRFIRAREEQAA